MNFSFSIIGTFFLSIFLSIFWYTYCFLVSSFSNFHVFYAISALARNKSLGLGCSPFRGPFFLVLLVPLRFLFQAG